MGSSGFKNATTGAAGIIGALNGSHSQGAHSAAPQQPAPKSSGIPSWIWLAGGGAVLLLVIVLIIGMGARK